MTYCRSIMLMLAIRINCPSANCKWPRCSMLSRPHTHTHSKKKSERSVELYVYSFVSGREPTKVLDTECERQIEIGFSQNTIIVCSSSMHIQLYVPCYTFTCLHSFFLKNSCPVENCACFVQFYWQFQLTLTLTLYNGIVKIGKPFVLECILKFCLNLLYTFSTFTMHANGCALIEYAFSLSRSRLCLWQCELCTQVGTLTGLTFEGFVDVIEHK